MMFARKGNDTTAITCSSQSKSKGTLAFFFFGNEKQDNLSPYSILNPSFRRKP